MTRMGRKLEAEDKIQTPSIPEVKHGIANAAMRLERKVKFNGRKLRPGPLMNAVFLWYLTQPEDVQEAIARKYVGKLEGILSADEPVELETDLSQPVPIGQKTVRELRQIAKDVDAAIKLKSS